MANTFGKAFRVTTWGESHGKAVGCVVDGCPSNLELTLDDIQTELDRRRPGQSSVSTSRAEDDAVEILSGVFEGKTLGTPISMLVANRDADSSKYEAIRNTPRPGHADFTWREKFGHVDWRGGGRASARETVGRVAAGAVAKALLDKFGVSTVGFARSIAGITTDEEFDATLKGFGDLVDSNSVRCPDPAKAKEMEDAVLAAKAHGDSVGGIIESVSIGVPAGIGEPVFDKLDAELAKALMSIPAVKGVEVGGGFGLSSLRGSEANDAFVFEGGKIRLASNHCGGILGGISTGMPIIVRAAVKPTASVAAKQKTVNLETRKASEIRVTGRHDPCIVPRAVPVVEAMVNLVLADHMMRSGAIPRRL
ncbi:MAG: chorismate synthase [Candidatus Altiarchaeota archaeon]